MPPAKRQSTSQPFLLTLVSCVVVLRLWITSSFQLSVATVFQQVFICGTSFFVYQRSLTANIMHHCLCFPTVRFLLRSNPVGRCEQTQCRPVWWVGRVCTVSCPVATSYCVSMFVCLNDKAFLYQWFGNEITRTLGLLLCLLNDALFF
jgi:hypothetical protein